MNSRLLSGKIPPLRSRIDRINDMGAMLMQHTRASNRQKLIKALEGGLSSQQAELLKRVGIPAPTLEAIEALQRDLHLTGEEFYSLDLTQLFARVGRLALEWEHRVGGPHELGLAEQSATLIDSSCLSRLELIEKLKAHIKGAKTTGKGFKSKAEFYGFLRIDKSDYYRWERGDSQNAPSYANRIEEAIGKL